MIKEFVKRFEASKEKLRESFAAKHPEEYMEIVKVVIGVVSDGECSSPDASRIHLIDDGDYQGTLLFIIAAIGHQPSDYWYVKVGYGSCSGCDTLQRIREYSDEPPTESQLADYMTLALHVVQGLKKMGDSDDDD